KICRLYCDDEEHRKDLLQEILVQLWNSFSSFRGDSKFSSWMYSVALNVAIQDFRKEKKRKLILFESYEFKASEPDHSTSAENEQLKAMYQAIAKLDKVEKAIILLYLEGSSYEEIAEIIGITQNYVRVKMNRIKQKISKTVNQ
ncbi:MAG: sigma-70 family RNA polymerase sigma factor, partial [Fulvivirga sp.]